MLKLPAICLVLPSLSVGGAERVGAELAAGFSRQGATVEVITLRSAEDDFYRLPAEVQRTALGVAAPSRNVLAALLGNLRTLRALRRRLRAARRNAAAARTGRHRCVVVSFVDRTNVRVLLAALGLGLPVIVAERNDLSLRPETGIWARLRKLTYPFAKAVVVQTERALEAMQRTVPRARRVAVIPNSVPAAVLAALEAHPGQPAGQARRPGAAGTCAAGTTAESGGYLAQNVPGARPVITILAVGKLHPQKGFDLLLEAFAELMGQRVPQGGAGSGHTHPNGSNIAPELRLVILGEGPERAELEALRRRLELENCVELPGAVTDPVPWYQAADVFVLSSRYEGFPNVLLEAMAAGCACVSFDCPAGPREALVHEENGLLVPAEDTEALAAALRKLVSDSTLRQQLGREAASHAGRYFAPHAVQEQWLQLIGEVCGDA